MKFNRSEEANQAIITMSGHKVDNKTLMCKLSNTFSVSSPCNNLYIKHSLPRTPKVCVPTMHSQPLTATHSQPRTHSHALTATHSQPRTHSHALTATHSQTHTHRHSPSPITPQHQHTSITAVHSNTSTIQFTSFQFTIYLLNPLNTDLILTFLFSSLFFLLSSHISPPPFSLSLDELCDTFKEFGLIETVKIVRTPNKPNDVVGLVRYPNNKKKEKEREGGEGRQKEKEKEKKGLKKMEERIVNRERD